MPGILGYLSDRPIDPARINAMVQPMLHRPTYRVWQHTEGVFGTATIDLVQGHQTAFAQSSDGRYLLVLFGAVYEPGMDDPARLTHQLLDRWVKHGSTWASCCDYRAGVPRGVRPI